MVSMSDRREKAREEGLKDRREIYRWFTPTLWKRKEYGR